MEVLGTAVGTITNDTFMDDLGTSGADGTLIPGQRASSEYGSSLNTDNKSDGSPSSKSPVKKVPDVSELPVNISKSRTIRFHKLFKSAPVDEYPIESFSCAFKGDILLHGQMYVSHKWLCFYSKIKAKGRCIEIPFDKIISITREKLALIIPNAIGIQIADHKYVFGSFISRDSTYKKLVTLWKINQDMALGDVGLGLNVGVGVLSHSNSADSSESDTTEDDVDAGGQLDRVLSAHRRIDVDVIKHTDSPLLGRQPGIQPCLNCSSAVNTFFSFSLKLQKIPRTSMLLGICTILVFFLLLSAMGLTYKILLLQSKLEIKNVWSPHSSVNFRDRAMSNLYWLQTESHASVVRQLHSVLEANIHLLEEVNVLLKSLHRDPQKSSNCSKNDK
ncbi:GRAM domain-containing protein 2B-like isoform X2 [Physella acuta]|uniref:GRAM domain-containing protein 2B-like isoform X2 n=1 Tax=Physella acuta TaxID=109671 RepID=UPI0027DBDFDA|nr:GRAM domain-containing protein 2B-like isoform X2 [Physella acuta]